MLIWLVAFWVLWLGPAAYSVSREVEGAFQPENVSEIYEGNTAQSSSVTGASETAAISSELGGAGVVTATALAESSSDTPQSANELFGLDEPAEGAASSEPGTLSSPVRAVRSPTAPTILRRSSVLQFTWPRSSMAENLLNFRWSGPRNSSLW